MREQDKRVAANLAPIVVFPASAQFDGRSAGGFGTGCICLYAHEENWLWRRGATVNPNAALVCGHEVGSYVVVAAGPVVTKDVASYQLVPAVPAPARPLDFVYACGDSLRESLRCGCGPAYERSVDVLRPRACK